MEPWMLEIGIVVVISLVAYLLRNKDEKQEKRIDKLFDLHDADSLKLTALELKIASDHYVKPELDAKFDRMENTFRTGFESLGSKFDKLSNILIAHVAKEDGRNEHDNRQE
jgi:hypothetical protein